ncbi:unnamed protein product, partial [Rotaria sp. Silwood1]
NEGYDVYNDGSATDEIGCPSHICNGTNSMMSNYNICIQRAYLFDHDNDDAVTLGRQLHALDHLSHAFFFYRIHQDSVIDCVRLLAQPSDLGEGNYQISKFLPN